MKKKYLITVEDVVALKDTDTKIYAENLTGYYQFVNGVLCKLDEDGFWHICPSLMAGYNHYILEEDPMQEATEEDVGKLCWFWDASEKYKSIGILDEYDKYGEECKYFSRCSGNYSNGRRLSPAEVAEITGYKVEEK